MFTNRILSLEPRTRSLFRRVILTSHTGLCSGQTAPKKIDIKRAERSGKCRLGFIPEEWFLFFHSKTGVSGPYVFAIVLANYCFSKEIIVAEHEYYCGLSVAIIVYLVVTKMGPAIGARLDKEVDAVAKEWIKGRNDDIKSLENIISEAKTAQWMAEGQKQLIDAKKENVNMQLEAVHRERAMLFYHSVKGRMDYHVKKYYAEARVHQKWMIGWILDNVMKSINEDFEKRALDQAISDLEAAASSAD